MPQSRMACINVRYGSLADIVQRPRHVCFTPNSGHSSVRVGCPKSATSGHRGGTRTPTATIQTQKRVSLF